MQDYHEHETFAQQIERRSLLNGIHRSEGKSDRENGPVTKLKLGTYGLLQSDTDHDPLYPIALMVLFPLWPFPSELWILQQASPAHEHSLIKLKGADYERFSHGYDCSAFAHMHFHTERQMCSMPPIHMYTHAYRHTSLIVA